MSLYETDFYAWTERTAELLRAGRWEEIDRETVAEEIESLGRSERHALESRLAQLAAHLLKWKYQPEFRGASWQRSLRFQRMGIEKLLKDNPSLKHGLEETLREAWERGRDIASGETAMVLDDFPLACPWAVEQVLDRDFFPEPWIKELP
jgi:Domain of unknown function DUF29